MNTVSWTLALIKPDATRRALVGAVVQHIEQRCFHILQMRLARPTAGQVVRFYAEHRDKPFFAELVNFMSSGPIYALHLGGIHHHVVEAWRVAMGPSAVEDRPLDSIRGALAAGRPQMENLVHGSDSQLAALREIGLCDKFGWL